MLSVNEKTEKELAAIYAISKDSHQDLSIDDFYSNIQITNTLLAIY
jgi:hypothetical protein